MTELLTALFSLGFLAALLRWTVPLALAALGGLISERSGVVNIALEGLMVVGAFAGACGAHYGEGALVGVAAGMLAGALVAALFAFAVVVLGADAIVAGVALNLLGDGLARYLLKLVFGSAANSRDLTALHPLFGSASLLDLLMNPLVLTTVGLALGLYGVLGRTRFGLRLRAAGENPEAAASLGVEVRRLRFVAVMLSGAVAGLAGVWLVLALRGYSSGMVAGRGYIALAALIFGGWRPGPVLGAALLFGLFQALAVQLRLIPAVLALVPEGYVILAPYVLTIVALVATHAWGTRRAPAALGRPLEP